MGLLAATKINSSRILITEQEMSFYKINKILVPVDFSETSLNALDTAIAIAKKNRSAIQIVNVLDNTMDFDVSDDSYIIMNSITENSNDILNALASALEHKHGIKPEVLTAEGMVCASIVKTAMLHHSDLIVMGTHGASGYREYFIGCNTYGVIKHACCPVLTVPPQKKWTSFKNVLFPVRPISGALTRYDLLRKIMTTQNSSLQILGLSYRKQENEKVLEDLVHEIRHKLEEDKVQSIVRNSRGKNIAEDVLDTCSTINADMVVITSSVDVTSKQFFVGPNTQRIISHAKVPVLCVRRLGVTAMA
jgi:nucleotide-binding universal stress UspA family protein